jgi:hypothetical protein
MTRIGDMPRTPAPAPAPVDEQALRDINDALLLASSMTTHTNALAHSIGAHTAAEKARSASTHLAGSRPDASDHARKAAEAFDRASAFAFSDLSFNLSMLEGVAELNKAAKGAA